MHWEFQLYIQYNEFNRNYAGEYLDSVEVFLSHANHNMLTGVRQLTTGTRIPFHNRLALQDGSRQKDKWKSLAHGTG